VLALKALLLTTLPKVRHPAVLGKKVDDGGKKPRPAARIFEPDPTVTFAAVISSEYSAEMVVAL
jgi:hypothetical protein